MRLDELTAFGFDIRDQEDSFEAEADSYRSQNGQGGQVIHCLRNEDQFETDSEGLRDYLRVIKKYSRLPRLEELELAQRVKTMVDFWSRPCLLTLELLPVLTFVGVVAHDHLVEANLQSSRSEELELAQRVKTMVDFRSRPCLLTLELLPVVMLVGIAARDRLVNANLLSAYYVARKAINNGARENMRLLDLIQEANIALIKAVEAFDPNSKTSFYTFAFRGRRKLPSRIEAEVSKVIARKAKRISIPRRMVETTQQVYKAMRTFTDDVDVMPCKVISAKGEITVIEGSKASGSTPTYKALTDKVNLVLPKSQQLKVKNVIDAIVFTQPTSELDANWVGNCDSEAYINPCDEIEDLNRMNCQAMRLAVCREAVYSLPEFQRKVILARYFGELVEANDGSYRAVFQRELARQWVGPKNPDESDKKYIQRTHALRLKITRAEEKALASLASTPGLAKREFSQVSVPVETVLPLATPVNWPSNSVFRAKPPKQGPLQKGCTIHSLSRHRFISKV